MASPPPLLPTPSHRGSFRSRSYGPLLAQPSLIYLLAITALIVALLFVRGRLAGKVAVITGGASGIGKATAAEFVRNGARVIIADVQDDLGWAVAEELGGRDDDHSAVRYVRCDVTDEAQVAAAVDLAVALHGRLDVMFNNAGITGALSPTPLGSMDMADFDRVMAVNLRGVVAGVKHAARVMVPRRRGSIICTASTTALLGGLAPPAYTASKAAVAGLVRATAGEMARSGVRVNAISPHAVPTPLAITGMAQWFPGTDVEERRRIVEEMNEMVGPALEAEDIARAAMYLASDEAKYVNGHNLVVDGGFTVNKQLNVPAPGRHNLVVDGGFTVNKQLNVPAPGR
ncbi:hypothetical protein U9M48_016141 [Paspalum notatum var. saurae]|uniref:Ketoreductase domain-containing protein n=1 Tax=Paspalum notatum var. saurae TaxID=547442 RepID=A0AAQ3T6Q3_PASNO